MTRTRSFLHALGSLWFASIMLLVLAFAMGAATLYEAQHGTEHALANFYLSWWFIGLLLLFAVGSVATLLARLPFGRRDLGFFCTHVGAAIVLLGGLLTHSFAERGKIAIAENETTSVFHVEGTDVLTLRTQPGDASCEVDLTPLLGRGIEPMELSDAPAATAGDGVARPIRYLADSEYRSVVHDDSAEPRHAIQVAFLDAGAEQPGVVPDDRATRVGDQNVTFRRVGREELARLRATPTAEEATKGQIVITFSGQEITIPVTEGGGDDVPLGNTGLTARLLRYLPHAVVSDDSQVLNRSSRPVNPYVEVRVSGPDSEVVHKAFAKFPAFSSMHGGGAASKTQVRFVATAWDAPATPVEVLAADDGTMIARFDPGSDLPPVVVPVELGVACKTPWRPREFVVKSIHDHARIETELVAIVPPRDKRRPGMILDVSCGEFRESVPLQKHERKTIELEGGAIAGILWREETRPLGFSMKLNRFSVGTYPGSGRPRSFESQITITDPSGAPSRTASISMNHPASSGDYSLFQSSYEKIQGRNVSILSVSRDPGQIVVYVGYAVMVLGMLLVLGLRMTRKTPEDAHPARPSTGERAVEPENATRESSKVLALIMAVALLTAGSVTAQKLPSEIDTSVIRSIAVQHDGRWMPLETLARDVVHKITGSEEFEGDDAVLVLLAWTFDPVHWQNAPLIEVSSAAVRKEMGLPADETTFAFSFLLTHPSLRPIMDGVARLRGRKPDPLEKEAKSIHDKLILLQKVFTNRLIKPVPHGPDANAEWLPAPLPEQPVGQALRPLQKAWGEVRAAFATRDVAGFTAASENAASALSALPASYRPDPKRIETELTYNSIEPFRLAWKVMAFGALLAAVAMFLRSRWLDGIVAAWLVVGFGLVTWGLALRWEIAGRIPASNMFESMLFLSWGMGAFAIIAIFVQRHRLVPLTASALGALALLLAHAFPMDRFVRPAAPVLLDTVWMAIHVPIIMVSYSVLALAMLIAHVQIVTMAVAPGRKALIERIDRLHYWYVHVGVILLLVGILTGSIWAASSWGRYWGWDPKEVWSLVAALGYLTILHVRMDHSSHRPRWLVGLAGVVAAGTIWQVVRTFGPLGVNELSGLALGLGVLAALLFLHGRLATAVKSVLCFWLVIMTYIGVNYVIGKGLHSYGFGTGSVAGRMAATAGCDLAIVGACVLTCWIRSRGGSRSVARLRPSMP